MRYTHLSAKVLILLAAFLNPVFANMKLQRSTVTSALSKAKNELKNEQTKASVTGGILMSEHSYVKLSALTEKIGLASNENLLAYKNLMAQGFLREDVLRNLYSNRPDVCFQNNLRCNKDYPYRSINGTCNNLQSPLKGSILTPFRRIVASSYSDGYNMPRGGRATSHLPNSRLISTIIHSDLIKPDPSITNMVPQFGQFLDHDLTLTPEGDKHCCASFDAVDTDCWSIPVYNNDTFFSSRRTPQRCLDFTRSTAYCFPTGTGPSTIREQMNTVTAYTDASNVYGSDDLRSSHLKEFSKGRLRVSTGNNKLLPTVKQVEEATGDNITFMGDFLGGDDRVNEMPALAVLHTLFVREHNRIAGEIYNLRPTWADETIFQETRRILIAEWQNIVYDEYLPIILGEGTMSTFKLSLPKIGSSLYTTYNPTADATIFNSFATAAYRFGHSLINGLIQLMKGISQVGSYRLRDNFFVSTQLTQQTPYGFGYDLILGGLMTQNAQAFDECVTEDVTNFLLRSPDNDFGSDLIARNLQRGRDHGLRGYGEYRKVCGLSSLGTWTNRPNEISSTIWNKLASIYNSPNDIDLFTGGISEYPVPGAVSGATFNCLKALQFSELKNGDRFFFTHSSQPRPFTTTQLQSLRKRTLGDIICENSDLESTPRNVFRTGVGFNGVPNPRIRCDDFSRSHLNISDFV